jgi:hypothetical protein
MRQDGIVDRISFNSSKRDCVAKIWYSGFGGIYRELPRDCPVRNVIKRLLEVTITEKADQFTFRMSRKMYL